MFTTAPGAPHMITAPTTPTDALLRQWATWQRGQGLAPRTISSRAVQVRKLEAHAGVAASTADVDHLMAYIATCGPSRSTKATNFNLLRAWFRWLCRAGHRDDDPTLHAKAPRAPRRTPRPIADQHLPILLAANMWHRTRVMILLAALAGLRVHEIAKVRGEDVDTVGLRLHVEGKGDTSEDLPLHPMLAEAAKSMPAAGWWFPAFEGGSRPGQHVTGQSVSTAIGNVMRRCKVPGSAHSLRHWFGTTLVDSGTDLRTAQTLLRHASLATTQIYTLPSQHRRTTAVAGLDPFRASAA